MKLKIIVMDGGISRLSDTLVESLKNLHPKDPAQLIMANGNAGCGAARNEGVKKDIQEAYELCIPPADIYLTLDSDIILTQPVLDKIRKRFEDDPKLGVLGARLYYPNGTINHAGGWISEKKAGHYGQGKTDEEVPYILHPYYCEMVTGAFFAFRRQCYEQVGPFYDKERFGPDDHYFCLKAWEAGWKVLYDSEIKAVHVGGGVRGGMAHFKDDYERESLLIESIEGFKVYQDNVHKWDYNTIFKAVHRANCKLYPQIEHVYSIERYDARGDVLATTPALHRLKKNHPEAKIYYRTNSPDVLKNNPDVTLADKNWRTPLSRRINLNYVWEMNVNKNMYEIYDREINGEISNGPLIPVLKSTRENEAHVLADMVEAFNGKLPNKIAAIHMPKTHWISKSLPDLFWRKVFLGLSESGITPMVIGSKTDNFVTSPFAVDCRGGSFQELREFIRHSDVFIGMDSAPMHVCLTTDTPGIALFTGTHPDNILPRGQKNITPILAKVSCVGCHSRQKPPVYSLLCPDNREFDCTRSFEADEIVDKAVEILKMGGK